MVKVKRSGRYERDLHDLLIEHEELENIVEQRIILFRHNPSDTRLDNHSLRKSMKGRWAFSITNDVRIVYEWIGKSTVRFLAIGPHIKVYKSPKVKEKN